jgi:hypothetical protein
VEFIGDTQGVTDEHSEDSAFQALTRVGSFTDWASRSNRILQTEAVPSVRQYWHTRVLTVTQDKPTLKAVVWIRSRRDDISELPTEVKLGFRQDHERRTKAKAKA